MRLLQSIGFIFSVLFVLSGCNEQSSVNSIPIEVADVANIHHPNETHFTSGQPTEAQLAAFENLGVTTVVNLRSHREMEGVDEATWASELSMSYYHLPVAGGGDLTRENVAEFHRIMTANDGENVLIHCASSNRVGAMTALRAAWFQGASKADAIKLGRDYGLKSLEPQVEKLLNE